MLFWVSYSFLFFFYVVHLNSAFARHCGNYSSLKSIILKCLLHISTHPRMPYVTCSCLIFQALGSLFPSLYGFPVTPILSYSFLASNLSFFPLLAPNFYYYTHGEDRKWRFSIPPRKPSLEVKEPSYTSFRLPVFFSKTQFCLFCEIRCFSPVHDRWRKQHQLETTAFLT